VARNLHDRQRLGVDREALFEQQEDYDWSAGIAKLPNATGLGPIDDEFANLESCD
jgi:hypothetical protein